MALGSSWKLGRAAKYTVLFIFCAIFSGQGQRTLNTYINYDCPRSIKACHEPVNGSFHSIVYTHANGSKDTMHYLMSNIGIPAVLVAKTDLSTTLHIDWPKLLSDNETAGSITFSTKPHYVYTLMFSRLFEYDDVNDTSSLTKMSQNESFWKIHQFEDLQWENTSLLSDEFHHKAIFLSSVDTDSLVFKENGSLSFNLTVHGDNDVRSNLLPHLSITDNTTQLDFTLDRLNSSFNKSRFALEMYMFTTDAHSGHKMELHSYRSIDDEYAPGVFEVVDWTANGPTQTEAAYVQWKPVCYTHPQRGRDVATKVRHYDLKHPNVSAMPQTKSIAYAYFGETLYEGTLPMTATNVSFGLTEDKFYLETNYTSWTANIAYGTPPQEKISFLIIIIISVGLGLPVVFIIFGGLCVCIKKKRDQSKGPGGFTSSYTAVQ